MATPNYNLPTVVPTQTCDPATDLNALANAVDNALKNFETAGGSEYTLPVASSTTLGGVRVGSGLSISGTGVLSAAQSGGGTVTPGSITSTELADGAVTASKLSAGSVGSSALASGAVTGSKIASGSVTKDKLGSDITDATPASSGFMSAADKASLDALTAADTVSQTQYPASGGGTIRAFKRNGVVTITAQGVYPTTTVVHTLATIAQTYRPPQPVNMTLVNGNQVSILATVRDSGAVTVNIATADEHLSADFYGAVSFVTPY